MLRRRSFNTGQIFPCSVLPGTPKTRLQAMAKKKRALRPVFRHTFSSHGESVP